MRTSLFSRLSVRLSVGVAALFAVFSIAVAASTAALGTSHQALEDSMAFARAEREAFAISGAAREQYMHQVHGILTRHAVHLDHDHAWAAKLRSSVADLLPLVGDPERELLDEVLSNSALMGRTFRDEVLPAALAEDMTRVRASHDKIQKLMDSTLKASDRTVEFLAEKERRETTSALRRARTATVTAAVTTGLAAFVAVGLAIALIRGIVRPVRELNRAAARIGEGDFDAIAPPTGAAEFEELRRGLERMAAGLREREARLLKAERLAGLGALAAGVAHELNNPLGVVLGYAKTLRHADLPADAAGDLRIIEEEAQQCRRIVEDLVAFAREPRLERRTINVEVLARDVADRLVHSQEVNACALRVSGSGDATARIDPTRLAQVVRNLLLNAVAASPEGQPVDVEVVGGADQVTVRVKDRGHGIPDEDLAHLFEPFFSRRPGGTGLGLAVSHGIVTAHGGSIDVASSDGAGTTVTVVLPRNLQEAA